MVVASSALVIAVTGVRCACRLIRIHRTVCLMTSLLEYFTCREWNWTTDNIRQIINDMSPADRLVTTAH